MKTAAAVLALAATASAFSPAPAGGRSTALNTVFEDYVGAQDFKGDKFEFDPLGLATTYAPLVPFFREAETRHGRTAMLAVLGFVATDFVRLPGEAYSFESIPKTIDAHTALISGANIGPMHQLLLWIGLFDLVISIPAVKATMDGERAPGDFGIKYIVDDEATQKRYEMNELLHGRLAMCAVGGIATQSVLSGHGFPYV